MLQQSGDRIKKTNIARLERIQHKVLRHLASLSGSPMSRYDHDYSKIAETFDMSTILSSMIASDNLFTFKIVSDTIRCPELKILFPLNNPSYPLRHNQPFYPPVPFTRHSETNPIYRLCTTYNALSHKTSVLNFTIHTNIMSRTIKINTLSYS